MRAQANDNAGLTYFRRHRHDVLNGLQLVKAYLQLHRNEDALRSLNDLVTWLQSLSALQGALEQHPDLFWVMATCPRLRIEWHAGERRLDEQVGNELGGILEWLDEQCNTIGKHGVATRIVVDEGYGTGTLVGGLRVIVPADVWATCAASITKPQSGKVTLAPAAETR